MKDKQAAVLCNHPLIAKTLDNQPKDLRLTLEPYDQFLKWRFGLV